MIKKELRRARARHNKAEKKSACDEVWCLQSHAFSEGSREDADLVASVVTLLYWGSWLRIDNDTSPVQERLGLGKTKERNQAKLSPPVHVHTAKVRKNPPSDSGHHAFERKCTSSLRPSKLFIQTGWHKRKEGTPSFQSHTMFKLDQNFEGNKPANTTLKKGLAAHIPSPSFLLTTSLSVRGHLELSSPTMLARS